MSFPLNSNMSTLFFYFLLISQLFADASNSNNDLISKNHTDELPSSTPNRFNSHSLKPSQTIQSLTDRASFPQSTDHSFNKLNSESIAKVSNDSTDDKKVIKVKAGSNPEPLAKCGGYLMDDNNQVVAPCPTLVAALNGDMYTQGISTDILIEGDLDGVTESVEIPHDLDITGTGTIPNYGKTTVLTITGTEDTITHCSINSLKFTYDNAPTIHHNADDNRNGLISTGAHSELTLNSVSFSTAKTVTSILLTSSLISASEGKLTLNKCTFTDIRLKDSPLLLINTAKDMLAMKDTNTFNNITRETNDGAVFSISLDNAELSVTLTGATFDSCSVKDGAGGAIAVTASGGSFSLTCCTFNECSSSKTQNSKAFHGSGGAIYLSVTNTPALSFSKLLFKDCKASLGTVIALECEQNYVEANYSTFGEFFKLGRKTNIAVYGKYDDTKNTMDVTDLFTLIPETVYVDAEGTDSEKCGKGAEGEKKGNPCKTLTGALNTYSGLVNTISFSYVEYEDPTNLFILDKPLYISGILTEEGDTDYTTLKVNNYADNRADQPYVFYIGNNEDTMTISMEYLIISVISQYTDTQTGLALFSVSTEATLELFTVSIVNDASSTKPLALSLIDAKNGKLSLSSCEFTNFSLVNASLIDIPVSSLVKCSDNSFKNIIKEEGNGAVMNLEISADDTFVLAYNNFTSCVVKNGNGGAISIEGKAGTVTLGPDSDLLIFANCSASKDPADTQGKTGLGGALYINVEQTTVNISTSIRFSSNAAAIGSCVYISAPTDAFADLQFYFGLLQYGRADGAFMYVEAEDETRQAKNLYELAPTEIIVNVNAEDASDSIICGKSNTTENNNQHPCDSLTSGHASFYGIPQTLLVSPGNYFKEKLTRFIYDCTIKNTGTEIVELHTHAPYLSIAPLYAIGSENHNAKVTFIDLTFLIHGDHTIITGTHFAAFLIQGTSSLSLERITCTTPPLSDDFVTLFTPLIQATEGRLNLKDCTFYGFSLVKTALIDIAPDCLTFSHSQNHSNTFEEILRSSGDGSIYEATIDGQSLSLEGITCRSCALSSGNGGAFAFKYVRGTLILGAESVQNATNVTTRFFDCSAYNRSYDANKSEAPSAGAGGAVFIDIITAPKNNTQDKLILGAIQFSNCEAVENKFGNGIYIKSSDAAADALLQQKSFWQTLLSLNSAKALRYIDSNSKTHSVGSSFRFPLWALILIIVIPVIVILIAIAVVVICCCCKRSESRYDSNREKAPLIS